MVQESIEPARKMYTELYGGEAPSVNFDTDKFLPEAPTGTTDISAKLSVTSTASTRTPLAGSHMSWV